MTKLRKGLKDKLKCSTCDREYETKSGLNKHQKNYLEIQRVQCNFCGKIFRSHASVRIHERRAHESEYRMKEETTKLPPETKLMASIAAIEAKS